MSKYAACRVLNLSFAWRQDMASLLRRNLFCENVRMAANHSFNDSAIKTSLLGRREAGQRTDTHRPTTNGIRSKTTTTSDQKVLGRRTGWNGTIRSLASLKVFNDAICPFYPKNDSSFTHFLDLSDVVQVKGSYMWAKFKIIYLKITINHRGM